MGLDYFWVFMTGFAGSLHCLGMCGPLVAAYSLNVQAQPGEGLGIARSLDPRSCLVHHGLFHTGRIGAYSLMGALSAGLIHLSGFNDSLRGVRPIVSIAGGSLMVILGLILLGIIAFPLVPFTGFRFGRALAGLLKSRTLLARLALGFAAGFLPCMLSWSMVVKAAATGNLFAGFLVMVLFGLGTAPALLFLGFFASLFTLKVRMAGERLAALSIIAMGLVLLGKGLGRLV